MFFAGTARESGLPAYVAPKGAGAKERSAQMALTRKFLKAMGVEEDKVEQIIEAHTATVDGLQADLEKAQADAKGMPGLQKELQAAKEALSAAKDDGWKERHDALKKEFEDYKSDISAKEAKAAKESAVRAYFESKGITGKALGVAMRGSAAEIDAVELVEGGKLKDTAALDALVEGDFSGLVGSTTTRGADTAHPPANNGGGMTKADIYKKDDKGRYLMSASERQRALMENQIM